MSAEKDTRGPARTVPWLIAVRLLIVVGCTVGAFWNLWRELIEDVQQGSDIGYVFALPVLAVLATIGMALRRRPELPIYDRQTDIIVGLIGLVATALLIGLLVLRYPYEYEALHLDLLAATFFAISVSVLMFGLRPVFRFWPVGLLMLLTVVPMPYRLAVASLGGNRIADGAVMLIPAAAAAAIGAGRTRGRALAGGLVALVAGGVLLAVMAVWFPHAPLIAYQLIPSLLGAYTATTVMYLDHRRWTSLRPLDRPFLPPTASRSRAAALTAVIAAALLALIPVPEEYVVHAPQIAGLRLADSPAVAPGWQLTGERVYPWAPKYFGRGNSWTRQSWQAVRGNPAWDKESRRRRIAVDIVTTKTLHGLDNYREFTMYRLEQPRISPPERIDLGHGVQARLNTVVDDRQLLSWTWLTWTWKGEGGDYQRISLIAADNHLPDALFPQPEPSVTQLLDNQMHQILRGNAVVLNPESAEGDPDSEYKDRDMLTTVAREIVRIGAGE
ncbi:hypothetical protein [Nocardia heshunensis]